MSRREVAVCGARSEPVCDALRAHFAASAGGWRVTNWGGIDDSTDGDSTADAVVVALDYEESSCRAAAARLREWRGRGLRVVLAPFPIDFAFGFLPDLRRRAAGILAGDGGDSESLAHNLRRLEIDRDLRLADGDDCAPALAREIAADAPSAAAAADAPSRFLPVAALAKLLGFCGARIEQFRAAAELPPPQDDFAAGAESFAAWLAADRWLSPDDLLRACEYGFALAAAAREIDRGAVASCDQFHHLIDYSFFYPRGIGLAARTLNNLLWAESVACGGVAPRRLTLLLSGAFSYSEDAAGQALKAAAVSVLATAGDADVDAYRFEYLESLAPDALAIFPGARETATGKKIADLRAKIGDVL